MSLVTNALLLTVIIGAGTVGTAHARDVGPGIGGFYLGGAAARTEVDGVEDESGIGAHVYAGFDFFRVPAVARFGLELGHVRTRKIEHEGAISRINNTGLSAKATLTSLPLLDLHARLGYEDGDTSGSVKALGLTLKPVPVVGVRAEYARHSDFDAVMVGLRVRFR